MPEASRPGSATRLRVAPAMPAASMIRKAPSSGEPSSVLMAAKLPADAMIVTAIGGASRLARRTVSAASPPPMAISGASGPRTAPSPSVARAASTMPGRSRPVAGPAPVLKPEGRRVARRAGQVTDGEGHEQSAEHQPGHRPPGGRGPVEEADRAGRRRDTSGSPRRGRGSRRRRPRPGCRAGRRAPGRTGRPWTGRCSPDPVPWCAGWRARVSHLVCLLTRARASALAAGT